MAMDVELRPAEDGSARKEKLLFELAAPDNGTGNAVYNKCQFSVSMLQNSKYLQIAIY